MSHIVNANVTNETEHYTKMSQRTTITLTLECDESERARLIERFIQTANAVTGEIDDGVPGDPNGSKVDATGVVWDARFHGVNMSKNQDGTWRRKKGLSEQEKADADNYEAGCRGAPTAVAQAATGVVATAPVTAAAPAADVPSFLQTGTFAPAAAAPVMAMPGMPATAPVVPAPPAPVSYPELIGVFQATGERIGLERLQNVEIAGVYQRAGVTAMAQLENDPDIRIRVKQELDALA